MLAKVAPMKPIHGEGWVFKFSFAGCCTQIDHTQIALGVTTLGVTTLGVTTLGVTTLGVTTLHTYQRGITTRVV